MRRFSSYGPVHPDLHYYAPRKELIEIAYTQLMGENPQKGGHYFTVWAPRQTGKTWIMQEVLFRMRKDKEFDVLKINLESLKDQDNPGNILEIIARRIGEGLGKTFKGIDNQDKFREIFKKGVLDKPLVLILDEFDALVEEGINTVVSSFRDIYISRIDERDLPTGQKKFLLHGVALIGVRSVLGIENEKGSPFNVQRSVHIPNLNYEEVKVMFQWYEKESGQKVEQEVIHALYDETLGQPGLTCWLAELITETYNHDLKKPVTMYNFEEAYAAATHILPNNNIMNIMSKVDKSPYDQWLIEIFETSEKTAFNYEDKIINYLYMNGVIDEEKVGHKEYYVKFSCPFIQKRIFNRFSREMFKYLGPLIHPLDGMKDAVSQDSLNIPNILNRYKAYLKKNREMLFKKAPRRKADMRIYEAVYHFNLYRFLYDLLQKRKVEVIPEFPTGNGKIDLILKYREKVYALELKSFKDRYVYEEGIDRAAEYGKQLGLKEIFYLVFVEIKEEEAKELDQVIERPGIKVISIPIALL